jgi:molybdopterin-guanine dinucleotide biosynthesis protein A
VYLAEHAYALGLEVMANGFLKMRDLIDKIQNVLYVSTETLNQFDSELDTFVNFNTPEELRAAERRMKQK